MIKMTKVWHTLYGLSSNGTVKVWDITVNSTELGAEIVVVHGQLHGKKQTAIEKIKEGKNVGRSNETTPYEQAVLEAESTWKKKQDKGYRTTIDELNDPKEKPKLPMLAQKYSERSHNLVWPVYVQPKLNGARCLVRREGSEIKFFTRGNKEFKVLKHLIPDFLKVIPEGGPDRDGELYNHCQISFQKIMSLLKEEKNPDWDAIKKYIRFYNYDVATTEGFKHRHKELVDEGYIIKVPTYLARTKEEVQALHEGFMREKYEGTMIRSGGDEPYTYQYRSTSLQKNKDFDDAEFTIVGCKEGKGKDEGKAIFRCQTDKTTGGSFGDGSFDVRCEGEDEKRIEQWENWKSYVGKPLTVRFKGYSEEGIPQHPVGVDVRDYE